MRDRVLRRMGFTETATALATVRSMSGGGRQRRRMAHLMILAEQTFTSLGEPEEALSNWAWMIRSAPRVFAYLTISSG
jgi:hypothetical protein